MIMIPLFPLLPLLLLTITIITISKFISPKNRPAIPPGPYQWPVIGNIFQLGKLPHLAITRLAQTHGPLISLKLGSQVLVVGSSPAAAKEILKTHDRVLSGRFVRHEFKTQGSKMHNTAIGLPDECNEQWRSLRSVGRTELFSGKAIESQATLWSGKIAEMVEDLRGKEGSVVEIGDEVLVVALNILGNLVFSRDLVGYDGRKGAVGGGEMRKLLREFGVLYSTPTLTDLFPLLGDWDLNGMNKKFRDIFERMFAICDGIIRHRRKQKTRSGSSQHDLLDTLIKRGLVTDLINPFLLELFSGGVVSATSTITWALAELVKNQEAMQKLREELEKEVGLDNIEQSSLPNLPYLDACVKETMRLHPPVPLLFPHRAMESCNVMGYDIPKDTNVTVNVWAIGRDPSIWDDPLSYKPERFLGSGLDYKGNDHKYLPFGSGRRMCPGQPMGARVVPLVVATLVHLFDWSMPGNIDLANLEMEEKNSMTLVKEKHLCLVPKIRKQVKV
ncbi:hypothetical protein Vadar_004753 [Vaccinium darrowii]|uniref:Uncharacterized protein n=1 Tax=Vaccinium darrowii TaxID=229202 RepID=A0ACB7YJD0_9ERIC|nr:hypothetical protein Vadar_004753 [Vaccinium darrowii]